MNISVNLGQPRLAPLCNIKEIKRTWPRVYKTFSCSTQLNMTFIVDILIIISRINNWLS